MIIVSEDNEEKAAEETKDLGAELKKASEEIKDTVGGIREAFYDLSNTVRSMLPKPVRGLIRRRVARRLERMKRWFA